MSRYCSQLQSNQRTVHLANLIIEIINFRMFRNLAIIFTSVLCLTNALPAVEGKEFNLMINDFNSELTYRKFKWV